MYVTASLLQNEEIKKRDADIAVLQKESGKSQSSSQTIGTMRAEMERLLKEKREAWDDADQQRAQVGCMCVYVRASVRACACSCASARVPGKTDIFEVEKCVGSS